MTGKQGQATAEAPLNCNCWPAGAKQLLPETRSPRGDAAVKPEARGHAVDGLEVHDVLELAPLRQRWRPLHQPLHACQVAHAGRWQCSVQPCSAKWFMHTCRQCW